MHIYKLILLSSAVLTVVACRQDVGQQQAHIDRSARAMGAVTYTPELSCLYTNYDELFDGRTEDRRGIRVENRVVYRIECDLGQDMDIVHLDRHMIFHQVAGYADDPDKVCASSGCPVERSLLAQEGWTLIDSAGTTTQIEPAMIDYQATQGWPASRFNSTYKQWHSMPWGWAGEITLSTPVRARRIVFELRSTFMIDLRNIETIDEIRIGALGTQQIPAIAAVPPDQVRIHTLELGLKTCDDNAFAGTNADRYVYAELDNSGARHYLGRPDDKYADSEFYSFWDGQQLGSYDVFRIDSTDMPSLIRIGMEPNQWTESIAARDPDYLCLQRVDLFVNGGLVFSETNIPSGAPALSNPSDWWISPSNPVTLAPQGDIAANPNYRTTIDMCVYPREYSFGRYADLVEAAVSNVLFNPITGPVDAFWRERGDGRVDVDVDENGQMRIRMTIAQSFSENDMVISFAVTPTCGANGRLVLETSRYQIDSSIPFPWWRRDGQRDNFEIFCAPRATTTVCPNVGPFRCFAKQPSTCANAMLKQKLDESLERLSAILLPAVDGMPSCAVIPAANQVLVQESGFTTVPNVDPLALDLLCPGLTSECDQCTAGEICVFGVCVDA